MKTYPKNPRVGACFCQLLVSLLAMCWLLAVVKVFVIDSQQLPQPQIETDTGQVAVVIPPLSAGSGGSGVALKEFEYTIESHAAAGDINRLLQNHGEIHKNIAIPRFSEWGIVQQAAKKYTVGHNAAVGNIAAVASNNNLINNNNVAEPKSITNQNRNNINMNRITIPNPPDKSSVGRGPATGVNQQPPQPDKLRANKAVVTPSSEGGGEQLKPGTQLQWPPVLDDLVSTPPGEGYDSMPMTGLKVPRFWEPPSMQIDDLVKTGSFVNGEPTIYLMIASYRDFQCRETITSAYMRADHPERLYVGAVDQLVPGDVGCLDIDIPCSEDPTQMICKYRKQISVFAMDASYATGPVTARHIGDRMYRGQYFVMQMDAHCLFINHWDNLIIAQWRSTGNEMAVLSSYLTDVQGSIDEKGNSKRKTRPIMCNSDFEGIAPARYLRHGSQPEDFAAITEMPQLQPFWAAGFSFSRGHFKVQVPYDGYQPMVFQGEEIAIGVRGFTYGYDFYAPRDSVVFHEYAERSSRRKKIHMFWENSEKHKGEGQRSLRRSMAVIRMAVDIPDEMWDHREVDKYGLGKVRPVSQFYDLFLINPGIRKAVQLCPFVNSGIMHRRFQPHLSANGRGLDYSHPEIANFDTLRALNDRLKQLGREPVTRPT